MLILKQAFICHIVYVLMQSTMIRKKDPKMFVIVDFCNLVILHKACGMMRFIYFTGEKK